MQFAVIPFVLFSIFHTVTAASTPVCTSGFTLINNKCLKLYTTPASHSAAEESCRSVGATLVTVKNENENQAFTSIVGSTVSFVPVGSRRLTATKPPFLHHPSGFYSASGASRTVETVKVSQFSPTSGS
ncbi:hypothetical protein CRE_09480 [Caenorhabditis remanei]|uniref:C-type lectin domain-containing protein n=1 Tax=Caenorhabditis remanei TaxID=31234 RepID=E3MJ32_CAERE|nr:hypothetical protein CRE_09480 [Caenorhabditis remanei]